MPVSGSQLTYSYYRGWPRRQRKKITSSQRSRTKRWAVMGFSTFSPREPRLEVSPTSNRTQQKCPKIASKKENVHLPTINFQPAFCWLVWRARANLEVTKVCPVSTCVGFCWCGFGFTPNPRCWCSSTKMTVHFCAVDHNLELPASCLEDHLRTHFSG